MTGLLQGVEWGGDFVTAALVCLLILAAAALGYVSSSWRSLLFVWAIALACVAFEQLRWHDDPTRSGIDDLPPSFVLPFTPVVMLLPALGVALSRRRGRGRGRGRE